MSTGRQGDLCPGTDAAQNFQLGTYSCAWSRMPDMPKAFYPLCLLASTSGVTPSVTGHLFPRQLAVLLSTMEVE
jgi:hypothetical protein